ncbi:RHS repeat-associated core domain-containing protein [Flectobacillus sp. DC10W]|uniref:RHS repeat-associated core domain-containing protein n=1 Tax=Flectobacillus longus TaxID=2984207 RepID=A0ABT6YRV5_9BACT|nr:RHS repeat-associated core domain-containing protein [Flectobacillus longus]MDI9866327.1 RHS repeat-associated core domain-containing protein [Flectobacillus longus]
MGNTRVSFKANGSTPQATDYTNYDPWGIELNGTGLNNPVENRFKFLGRESIAETGWVDLMKRMYDPPTARFTRVDPSPDVAGQESLSTYQYGYNNPLRYPDPNGDCPNCITGVIGAGLGALIGGGIEAGIQLYQHGEINDWKAVGGAALQGGITGGAAGFTGGASLLVQGTAVGTANVVGGYANRTIQGQTTTGGDVARDFTVGAVAGVASRYLPKGSGGNTIKGGSWVTTNESMSVAASEYQTLITGKAADKSFMLNGVKFDGVVKGVLVDAKSGYSNFVNKSTGAFQSWFKGANGLVEQAERQLGAANGTKIQWYFQNEGVMKATQQLFKDNGIKGIELIYKAK